MFIFIALAIWPFAQSYQHSWLKQRISITSLHADIFYSSEAKSLGVSVNGIEISETIEGSLRGVLATRPIAQNEIIVTVPAQLTLETTNKRPPSPFPTFVSQSIWEDSKWDHR